MIWGFIFYKGVKILISVNCNINSNNTYLFINFEKYIDILKNNLLPLIVGHFLQFYMFLDDNDPFTDQDYSVPISKNLI